MNTDEQATNFTPKIRGAFRRRNFFGLAGAAGTGMAVWTAGPAAAEAAAAAVGQVTPSTNRPTKGMESVQFQNNGITMAGNLYFPANFNSRRKYPPVPKNDGEGLSTLLHRLRPSRFVDILFGVAPLRFLHLAMSVLSG